MLKGFRDFIMRGNVVDLAIAVVIGSAFAAVVMNRMAERRARRLADGIVDEPEAKSEDVVLLEQIRDLLANQQQQTL